MNVVLGEIGYLLNVMTRYSIQNDSFERAFCLGFFFLCIVHSFGILKDS